MASVLRVRQASRLDGDQVDRRKQIRIREYTLIHVKARITAARLYRGKEITRKITRDNNREKLGET
jgi:hypothetical protein